METKEVNITYETLFELLKKERDMADLQKLEPAFFDNFVDYLNEKKKMLGKEDNLFSYDEKNKLERQIENAKKLIRGIYEAREKKILNLAMVKSRTKSNVIDTSALLENEKKLFNEVLRVLNMFRKETIDNILDGKSFLAVTMENREKVAAKDEVSPKEDEKSEEYIESSDSKLVRFIHAVPKFVGQELEEYGPFDEEDIANLPAEIAELLISKGRAEEIKGN